MVEAGQIVSLLLSLADRLVRVDTCLMALDWPGGEQRQELEARRALLVSKHLPWAMFCIFWDFLILAYFWDIWIIFWN